MTLDKLKIAARQHEHRSEWRPAIDLYRQAITQAEAGGGGIDPSLYNRIGDLENRLGEERAATEAWEQAASRYGQQGFFNNAIAICGKILRYDPARVRTYLELARFQSRKRVIYDVRQNLVSYLEQMSHRGENDQAAMELEKLAGEFVGWRELGSLVNELLGREAASSEDGSNPESGSASDLVFLDTRGRPGVEPGDTADEVADDPDAELIVEPTMVADLSEENAASGEVKGLERVSEDPTTIDIGADASVAGLIDFDESVEAIGDTPRLEGIEETPGVLAGQGDADVEPITLDGLEPTVSDEQNGDTGATTSAATESESAPTQQSKQLDDGIIFLDTSAEAAAKEAASAADAEPTQDDDESPLAERAEGHDRLEQGDRSGAVEALERSLEGYVEAEQFDRAFKVATELIEAEPALIDRYQARVEIAVRMRDQERICIAYNGLADALVRAGGEEKAIAVYRRVLQIDDNNKHALTELRRMVPHAASEETEDGFIDFGAMVNEDVGPRSTRMRTETTNISDDEDETFKEALAEFKRALDQNLPIEDHQTHYDLGLAFKEMGLLNEAVSEFQKALQSPVGRLRTSEALGQCFFEQGRPAVAEAVLRSVEQGEEGDSEKIGVLYWLGRALEEQGKTRNARGFYERVLAVDVGFHDVSDRLTALQNNG